MWITDRRSKVSSVLWGLAAIVVWVVILVHAFWQEE